MNASEDKSAKADNSAVQRKRLSDQIGWRGLAGTILIVVVLILLTTAYFRYFGDHNHIKFVFVVAIGGLLGLTEILGRYTDSPTAALKSPGAVIYVLVNAIASGVALYLLTELAPAAVSNPISQVLLAGLGAMAFLRSSVFKAKVGNEEVPIGPAIILDTLLKFADAQVDRGRAEDRAERIGEVVQSLPLGQVGVDLPRLCFALMQNLSVDIQQKLLNDITLIVTDTKRSEFDEGTGGWTGAVEPRRNWNVGRCSNLAEEPTDGRGNRSWSSRQVRPAISSRRRRRGRRTICCRTSGGSWRKSSMPQPRAPNATLPTIRQRPAPAAPPKCRTSARR